MLPGAMPVTALNMCSHQAPSPRRGPGTGRQPEVQDVGPPRSAGRLGKLTCKVMLAERDWLPPRGSRAAMVMLY